MSYRLVGEDKHGPATGRLRCRRTRLPCSIDDEIASRHTSHRCGVKTAVDYFIVPSDASKIQASMARSMNPRRAAARSRSVGHAPRRRSRSPTTVGARPGGLAVDRHPCRSTDRAPSGGTCRRSRRRRPTGASIAARVPHLEERWVIVGRARTVDCPSRWARPRSAICLRGSTTSSASGPRATSARSPTATGCRPLLFADRGTPPKPSMMPRFWYLPRPKSTCSDPSVRAMDTQIFSVQAISVCDSVAKVVDELVIEPSSAPSSGPMTLPSPWIERFLPRRPLRQRDSFCQSVKSH